MGVVVALDAQRGGGQAQRLLQLLEGPGTGVDVGGPAQAVADELLLGVAGDRAQQVPLAAPLRHPDLHPGAPLLAQPRLVQVGVVGQVGDQHGLGVAGGRLVVVEALQHVADQLGPVERLDLVHHEAPAAHHPSPAHEEHLDGGLEVVLGQADHVEVLGAVAHDLLLLDRLAHRDQPVPHPGRPLELELVGGRPHAALEPVDDGVGVALEELQQLVDVGGVGLGLDGAHAGARALLDVVQQAGPAQPLVAVELGLAAGAQGERAQQQVERLPDGVGVGVGPEVAHALALGPPHHRGPGPLVGDGHGQERVALVVDQADVEAGPVLLDQRELEHQRLDLVADLDPLDGLGRGHHLRRAGVQVRRALEVVRQALAQRAGLADVDDPAVGVLELVGARGVGDGAGRRPLEHRCRA